MASIKQNTEARGWDRSIRVINVERNRRSCKNRIPLDVPWRGIIAVQASHGL